MTKTQYQKALLMVLLAAGLVGAWFKGWLTMVWTADVTGISGLIALMFVVGLWAMWSNRWSTTNWMAEEMLTFGLIGTVVGLIIAFSSLDLASISSASGAAAMVTTLVSGVGVALYTTLVGSLGYIWLALQNHLFNKGD